MEPANSPPINPLLVLPEGQGVRALDGVLIGREQR